MNSSKQNELRTSEATTMTTHKLRTAAPIAILSAVVAWAGVGCIEPGPRIDRVQTNLIDKSVFEGEWWFTHTVIDLSDEASWAIGQAGAGSPWPGATANFDIASQSGVVGRIRWVVDEGFLYAYRSTEIVQGSSTDADDPSFRGQPLAAYRIVGHFDVRQDFNPVTGEPGNVVSESQDRRWYDRRFVRVDWSQNLVTWGLFGASLEIDQLFGGFRREPIPLGVTDIGSCADPSDPETRCDIPAEWAPQVARVRDEVPCDGTNEGACFRYYDEWPADQLDAVHYMSFVTQELWTPLQCFGNICNTSITITVRDAFLRIPPDHEYAVETLANSEYDRFGIIRTESRTYLRGGEDRSTIGRHCDTDVDCDPACGDELADIACEVSCNTETHLCVGGLTNELGETDFLTYYRLRHNFYSDSLTEQECIADWQCNDRYEAGIATPDRNTGSVCDAFARRCTIPIEQRPIRQVHYTLSPQYPQYLVRSAFEIVAAWNDAFMRAARESREGMSDPRFESIGGVVPPPPSAERVSCQSTNPVEYCYCSGDGSFRSPEVDPDMGNTCMHMQTNYFLRPEERGETDPYLCWIEGPPDVANPTEFTDYGDDVYQYRFVGPECMLVLDVNQCDRVEGAACQQLGDLRYQFFNFVSGAGAGWCGVMQPNQDPVTGEAIISPVNQGGQCLDNIAQQALNIWPILRGEESADPLFQGEEIRQYFENLGRVRQPLGIAPGARAGVGGGAASTLIPADLHAHFGDEMERAMDRAGRLHGPEGRRLIHSDRIHQIAHTALEHRIVDGIAAEQYPALSTGARDLQALTQLSALRGGSVGVAPDELVGGRYSSTIASEETLDVVSPFRDGFMGNLLAERRRHQLLEQTGTCMMYDAEERAYNLISQYGRYWAEAFEGRDLAEARIRWAQAWHRAIMQHELGHGLGLEHNFAASLDRDQYSDPYFRINDQTPLPQTDEFDADRDGMLQDYELIAWQEAFEAARRTRNESGIGNWTAASTMDYAGDLSDIMGLGRYDRAAVYYNYFNQIEAYEGDPNRRDPGDSRDGLLRSDQHGRTLWTWYRGGDQCHTDNQCPFAAGSEALSPGQPLHQRCVSNPRYSSLPIPCSEVALDDPEAARHCVCSNFDEDFADYVDGIAYRDREAPAAHFPVQYMFCSNPRLNDISWCNVFDAGESFLEVLSNMRSSWESSYPTSYFRRFRRPFYAGTRAMRWIPDAAKIYQHLFFRYNNEPPFRNCGGPLCFMDQYQASIQAMNFFSYLAQLPDVGSYQFDPTTQTYQHMGETMGMAGADFSLAPGQGFHTWSAYQEGLLGFFRLERAGTFHDKLQALRALTIRDWGLSFTIDERYFINFYDLFPIEMTELFGGYVIDDARWFAPRVAMSGGEPQVEYLNWFRGNCRNAETGAFEPCRESNPEVFTGTPIGGTSNDVLRVYAAIYALAEFPVFYDSSWEQRLAIFKLGNADGFTIPAVQPDGTATCGLDVGTDDESRVDPSHSVCADPLDADYILYRSRRLHATFVAVKVRPRIEYNLEEEQLGFQLLAEMTSNQARIGELEALATRTPAEAEELHDRQRNLERHESFLETLIEVQRIFGISSWL